MFNFKFKKISWKIYLGVFVLLVIIVALVYINYKFGASKIEVEFFFFFSLSTENLEIKGYIEREVGKNADTLLNLFLLDNSLITKLVGDEYELVNRIDIDKKPYFNNFQDFGIKLYAVVIKNDEYFYACVEEKSKEISKRDTKI